MAAAKNVLTVGNCFAYRDDTLREDGIPRATPYEVHETSSTGPTAEGRIKPDVVAPGTLMFPPMSNAMPIEPDDQIFDRDSGTAMWQPMQGTSYSAAQVSGCAALLREALKLCGQIDPSGALLKALLINGAVDMSPELHDYPDAERKQRVRSEGWGRVNLGGSLRSVHSPSTATGGFMDTSNEQTYLGLIWDYYTRSGASRIIEIISIPDSRQTTVRGSDVDNSAHTLKATLTWCDPASPITMHHLALIAEHEDGECRHSNLGKKNMASSLQLMNVFDLNNTVQQIIWRDVKPGKVRLTVRFVLGPPGEDADARFAVAWSLTNC